MPDRSFRWTWPTELLHPLPGTITTTEGAVLEPLGVALRALDLGGLRAGSTASVIGCGPIGLLLLQLALVAGAARVVAVDPLEHRRHAALAFGAALALAPEDLSDRGAIAEAVGHLGVDVAFEVGGVNDAVEQAIAVTMPGGRVVLIGIPEGDRTSFRASVARRKGLALMMARRTSNKLPAKDRGTWIEAKVKQCLLISQSPSCARIAAFRTTRLISTHSGSRRSPKARRSTSE